MAKAKPALTVERHFAGSHAAVRPLYDQLLARLRRLGPFTEAPNQGSIHLVHQTVFAGVATRTDHLILSFKSDQPQPSARVFKTERASARRYYHYVKVAAPGELDDELLGWLAAAYALSG